ncbi:MAG: hypothetical protein AB7V46_22275 [Thermomicrobiales bacterium]
MADISALASFADEDPRDFSELVTSCGKIIDAWLDAGGEPTDEPVVGFYSLWAQSLDLTQPADAGEEASYFAWAYPFFVRGRNELGELLRAMPTKA